jgi:protein-tyrosine phosphatase
MIDLHCHIIPGIDDGAKTLEESLAMARMAVDDGIKILATTSHIFPGMFNNTGAQIEAGRLALQNELDQRDIPLRLISGADVQLAPGIVAGLSAGTIPALNGTRYFLFEPPHTIAPPMINQVVLEYCQAGYVPIVTHPERLTWIDQNYHKMAEFVAMGAWMQLTAGSLTGTFGPRPQYWSERMLDEGLVHIIASDGHNAHRRPPILSRARAAAARRVGEVEAHELVFGRPSQVVSNAEPCNVSKPTSAAKPAGGQGVPSRKKESRSFWSFSPKC